MGYGGVWRSTHGGEGCEGGPRLGAVSGGARYRSATPKVDLIRGRHAGPATTTTSGAPVGATTTTITHVTPTDLSAPRDSNNNASTKRCSRSGSPKPIGAVQTGGNHSETCRRRRLLCQRPRLSATLASILAGVFLTSAQRPARVSAAPGHHRQRHGHRGRPSLFDWASRVSRAWPHTTALA